jgi:multimeric flavodoxin WrbA
LNLTGDTHDRKRGIVIYWSVTGNTEKAAKAVVKGLTEGGLDVKLVRVEKADSEELYDFDVVVLASPSYSFAPPDPFREYAKRRMAVHSSRGDIRLKAPALPGKYGGVLVTFSGPHTGIDEAIPAGKWLSQFLAHIGFKVEMEEYVVGEFHGRLQHSTHGVMGDIRGRPNEDDLLYVREIASKLAEQAMKRVST